MVEREPRSGQRSDPGADDESGDQSDDDVTVVEQLPADAAFELLSSETRLRTLRALFDAGGALSFSALRDAVGTSDSGQFNYHLDKLRGSFVRQTEAGYELTAEGKHVVGSVLAGPLTKTVEADPVAMAADCPYCAGCLTARSEEDHVRVACADCDRNVIKFSVPPGAFEDYPRAAWPAVAERWTRRQFELVQSGFCQVCQGQTAGRLVTDPDGIPDLFDVAARYVCERCGDVLSAHPGMTVVTHPAVVAFLYERGVDVRSTPVWELDWAIQPVAEVVEEDPLRVEVPVTCDGDRLVLTVDETCTVVDERRC